MNTYATSGVFVEKSLEYEEMSDNNNSNPFNQDDEESQNNPYGFDFDPNALSSMFSEIFNNQGAGGFAIPNLNQGPMEVAEKVAADIASKEINENEIIENAEGSPVQDPMAEIMQIMKIMAMGSGVTKPLHVDSTFSARCEQIYPAAQSYLINNTANEEITNIPLVVTDRVSWTKDYITSLQGPLGAASKSLNPTIGFDEENEFSSDQGLNIQSLIAKTVGPMLFGVQAGTMVGYLSHRAYGDDDVLLPTQLPDRVGLIASAVQKFSQDWSISVDEAILYFLILQTLRAHLRSKGWLTKRLDDLCTQYVAAYELDPHKLEELMGEIDTSSENPVMAVNVTPEQMFEALRTPRHDVLDEEIGRISSLHEAYVEWVLHKDLEPLLPNYRIIQEARKRVDVSTSDADRFVEQLFGVAITPQFREKAQAFIDGVVERGEEAKLHQLWHKEEMIPTESEFAAPGLWLARLEVLGV